MSDMLIPQHLTPRGLAFAALSLLLPVALVPLAHAQGLSYDLTTSGTGMGRGSGDTATRVMTVAHGQFSNGNARLDVTQSPMVGGMMGQGTYMLASSSSSVSTFVDPSKREYFEIDRDDLARTGADLQKMTGGIAKTDVSDVAVTEESLGPGEPIDGYPTARYRITDTYTMSMSIMGHNSTSTKRSTTEIWVAPQLDGVMNPMGRQVPAAPGPMAALTAQLAQAYAKVGKGIVLRTRRTSLSEEPGGKQRTITMTTEISNIKRTAISPAVFVVPAGYLKAAALSTGLGALGAIGDSIKAARAAAGPQGEPRPSPTAQAGSAGTLETSNDAPSATPSGVADTVAAGAAHGALTGASHAAGDGAANKAKKAVGKLFGRP